MIDEIYDANQLINTTMIVDRDLVPVDGADGVDRIANRTGIDQCIWVHSGVCGFGRHLGDGCSVIPCFAFHH